MKVRNLLGSLLIAATAMIAAPAAQAQDKPTIAIIPLQLGHPWWVRAEEGAKRAGEELGVEIIFTAPEQEDAAKQRDVFADMVSRGVDAIIIAGVDSNVLRRPIKQAIDSGIPVFGFDIGVPETDALFTASGWEPAASGQNIARGLVEEIGGKGKVAILTGGLGSTYLAKRQAAIEAELAKHPDITVVGVYANDNNFEKALSQAESVLQAHPDLAGFASTVTTGVPAAAQAIINAGKQGKVAVWGTAMPKQNAAVIQDGTVKGALALDPGKMTYLGVAIAKNYLDNKALPKQGDSFGWAGTPVVVEADKMAYVEDTLLTSENVGEFDF